jgi:hypothetical protein
MRTLDTAPRQSPRRRDLSLLFHMAGMLLGYWLVGGRMRRRYRKKEARGETFFVDEEGPTRHREAPLTR